jgi:hypothetical protein
MKRDWDCIRAIFSALEDKGDIAGGLRPNQIAGFDVETVSYNMKLLIEGNLIGGTLSQMASGSIFCIAMSLTWDGHELFDKIRSETIWNKIKATARERAVPLSFEVVKILAVEAVKSIIGHNH